MLKTLHSSKWSVLAFSTAPVLNKKYYLPVDGEIANARITGLTIPMAGDELASSLQMGRPLTPISSDLIKRFTFTLCDESGREILSSAIPFDFNIPSNGAQIRNLNIKIDPKKCFVKLHDASGFAANTAIIFNWIYEPNK